MVFVFPSPHVALQYRCSLYIRGQVHMLLAPVRVSDTNLVEGKRGKREREWEYTHKCVLFSLNKHLIFLKFDPDSWRRRPSRPRTVYSQWIKISSSILLPASPSLYCHHYLRSIIAQSYPSFYDQSSTFTKGYIIATVCWFELTDIIVRSELRATFSQYHSQSPTSCLYCTVCCCYIVGVCYMSIHLYMSAYRIPYIYIHTHMCLLAVVYLERSAELAYYSQTTHITGDSGNVSCASVIIVHAGTCPCIVTCICVCWWIYMCTDTHTCIHIYIYTLTSMTTRGRTYVYESDEHAGMHADR